MSITIGCSCISVLEDTRPYCECCLPSRAVIACPDMRPEDRKEWLWNAFPEDRYRPKLKQFQHLFLLRRRNLQGPLPCWKYGESLLTLSGHHASRQQIDVVSMVLDIVEADGRPSSYMVRSLRSKTWRETRAEIIASVKHSKIIDFFSLE